MSKAKERGADAGYDARNYATAYGCETELSFYLYREDDGTREEYEAGFWEGVQQFDDEYEEENGA